MQPQPAAESHMSHPTPLSSLAGQGSSSPAKSFAASPVRKFSRPPCNEHRALQGCTHLYHLMILYVTLFSVVQECVKFVLVGKAWSNGLLFYQHR
jgi:hypothetical protein